MSRLLDEQAVVKIISKWLGYRTDAEEYPLRELLSRLPSAQPEPCEDAVSKEAVSSWLKQYGQDVLHGKYKFSLMYIWKNLMDLPPAQPEITEDQVKEYCERRCLVVITSELYARMKKTFSQPEPLTDKEQRIFLAAMSREEKVCEEVDRNYVREPYEDSLMSICREIKRKVKGALWGI